MNGTEMKNVTAALRNNMEKVIVGKEEVIDKVILSLFCAGHILLEDIPGTGKTTLAKALSKSIDCRFKRVQFTPDLLPSDLTGINFFNQKEGDFVFREGSVFTNILLADEINRATPRTQSSLLECMEEYQVTVDGETYSLASPFLVIATQNPIEIQGTFPLPEAQLDRFFMKLSVGYPNEKAEAQMLSNLIDVHPIDTLTPVCTAKEIIDAQDYVRSITVADSVKKYIVRLVNGTRNNDKIRLGVSPRGTLSLMRASQAKAAMDGRSYVTPDDVKSVAPDVLNHRIICKGYNLTQSSAASYELIDMLLRQTEVPTESSYYVEG